MEILRLHFDGSCAINPGGIARYGWRISDLDGTMIEYGHGEVCRGPCATNNVAEWAAVTFGLRYFMSTKWINDPTKVSGLAIYGDSNLVINGLNRVWKVKKPHLQPYRDECLRLLKSYKWTADWIPREENDECDALSNKRGERNVIGHALAAYSVGFLPPR